MATYDSIHTGEEIDNAVDLVQANASKGDASTPIYFDAEGNAVPITKSNSATIASTDLITSGAIYNGLATKYNKADISTDVNLGTSNTVISSQGAVKSYVDTQVATRQVPVTAGDYVKIEDNVISLDNTDDFLTIGELNNKVSYFENTELKEGETLIEKMESAKRSTFDLSKFTVVGNPNITNNGVASGFSSSNYLKVTGLSFGDTYIICGEADITGNGAFLSLVSTANKDISFYHALSTKEIKIFENIGFGGDTISYTGTLTHIKYKLIGDVNSNTYSFEYELNNSEIINTKNLTSGNIKTILSSPSYVTLGNSGVGWTSQWALNGSIDLKGVNVTVDGVEVFSGNKTGIDTIKPNDYTVVGSPTITNDGIASGLDKDNYVGKVINWDTTKPWEVRGKFVTPTSGSVEDILVSTSNVTGMLLQLNTKLFNVPHLRVALSSVSNSWDITGGSAGTSLNWNTTYYYIFKYTGTNYIVQISTDGENYTDYITVNNSTAIYSSFGSIRIGCWSIYGGLSDMKVDLNAFKIYVDGNLVYQPCLKIPYTWTSEGKKIVDSNYRSCVIDEYEQAGFTPYYTLSDTDCTLPTCKESDIVASYESGITKWVQYADFTLKQQGSCSADTTVTLPKKFRDTNYSVTVPYSNKQATSFTPTQAGDWIAIGKTSL